MKKFFRLFALTLFLGSLSISLFAQNKDWLTKMQDPNVNFWELQKEFNDYWKDRDDTKGNGYKVFKRWEYINELRADPNGKLPAPDKVLKEYEQYMSENVALKSASGTWSLVGPSAYPSNNTSQPTGMGRINTIAFHPTDPNTIYIGAPAGGIWKTVDGGANWINLSANLPYLGVSAIVIHPSDPNIIYIGTGDRDSEDAPGIGVYKSTDGGATWVAMNYGMGNTTVSAMMMHPSNQNIILAATYTGIYKSTNAGASWSLKQAGDFRDIKFKPGDPLIVYATRVITPSGFYRSTDNGETWTLITTPITDVGSRMVIGVSPANPACVYLVQIKSADNTFKALLRSTDSGLNFTEQSNSPNIFDYSCNGSGTSSQATYDLCIEVDQNDVNTLYVGSINTWKSTNGGASWTPKTHWVGSDFAPSDPTSNCARSVHADHHWLQFSPHNSARLFLGHDGGIGYSDNGGTDWTNISSGLSISQGYKIGQAAQSANLAVIGCQDNGVSATDNGSSFRTIGGGDGFDGIIDYNNSNFCYYATNGNLRRSTSGIFGAYSNISTTISDPASFFAAYMLHRTNPNTVFFGRQQVWRSTNVRAIPSTSVAWLAISTFTGSDLIRVIEQSPADPNIVYISRGSGSGSIQYRSDNANAASSSVVWTAIAKPGGLTPSGIKANYTDPNIVYATAGTKVFRSDNKGVSWTEITGNLPVLFINCLAIDKDANEGIYIGNQTGVWYKDATMTDWILFSSGLPPLDIRELEIYYDANPENSRITAASYGRGVWQSDLAEFNVADPSGLTASPVSSTQINLSWTLNAANNNVLIATSPTTLFGVPVEGTAYTAGNSLPGGGTVIYVGNLTNFSHTGLSDGADYCYKIWSVNGSNQYSAGLTPVCSSTFFNWTGNVDTDWFNPGNWGTNQVPTFYENAYLPAGRPNYPLINAAGAVCNNLTIESGASLSMDGSSSYTLDVGGDWTNDGTFNRGVGTVHFSGNNALQTIKGTSTTDFYILKVTKSVTTNILDVVSPITLNALVDAPLTLVSGTFRLSNASTNITAIRANGTLPDIALGNNKRIWITAGTLNVLPIWRLNQGELKVSGGTVNIGTADNVYLDYLNNAKVILESGQLNVSAGIWGNVSSSNGVFEISGGTLTVSQFLNGFSKPSLEVTPNCSFTMSGGTILIRRSNGHSETYANLASTYSVTGGTLQIGNATSPTSQTYRLRSTVPLYNLTINATNSPVAQVISNDLMIKNDLNIQGGTLNLNGFNLNIGGHWTNSGTFTPGTGIVTFNGTAGQNLAGNNATTFNNLTLNNAAGLTLSGSVNATVSGILNLTSGVISTGSNRVILPTTGSVTRTSGHIFGNLQKNVATGSGISKTFEIGDAAATNYTPATVTFASVTTGGNLTARTISGDHPQIASTTLNAARSVNRYWSLTNSGTAFTTYDAVFNFLSSDLDPSVNTNALMAGKYDASTWTYPAIGNRTANSTEVTGATAFSEFQLAEAGCINPDVPTLAVSTSPVCAGQPTTLNVTAGNLNGAAYWQWYEGSCGGTTVGTGTSLTVSPTSGTTYYARGEGGCLAAPGLCGNIAVSVNALPTPTITGLTSVCSGGSVTLDAGSGYASYAWSNGGGSSQTATFSNITTGTTYSVTVTDGNGCQGSDNHAVSVNALPTPTITGLTSVCSGGSVTLDAGSGYASYAWSNGGGSSQTATFSNITTGTTYSVTVTDGNGCQGSDNHAVSVNALPTPTITGLTSVCSGGSVTLDAGTYASYAWSNGGGGSQTATFSNITTGTTYSVTVTDGNGCQGSDNHAVSVNALPTPTITGLTSVCSGGSVTLDAGSGYASYAWSDGGGSSQTATFSNITTGTTYSVTVTDGSGCQGSDNHAVSVNALPTPTITGLTSVCSGGSVTLDAGSGYASYAWSNGGGSSQTATFSNITTGTTYSVTVTDGNGCQGSDNHAVSVNAVLTPTISGPTSVCSGGSVTLDAGSGYATYAWSNGGGSGQTATFSNITTGTTYSVTVTDGSGCQGSDNHAVSVNALPTPTITGLTSVCSGGSVTLDAGSGYASYAWSDGGGSSQTATFSNITTGTTYSVTVTDGSGCQGSDNHAVSVNALPTPTITGLTSVCSGGSVTLDAGSGYASYAWSDGGGSSQTATFSNITTGTTYSVTVTDGSGCQGSDNHAVSVNAVLTPTISGPTSVCSGGSVTLDAGSGYASYAWSNGGGSSQTATFSNITTGTTYSVTVTDGNGCQGSDNHAVSVNAVLTPTISGPTSVCSGGSVTLDAGSGYATYAWSNGGGSGQTATFSNITTGTTYSVTVTDGNGCQGSDNHAVSVNALPTPTITGLTSVCSGGSVTLDAGSGYASYAWSNSGGSNQTATFSNITNTMTYSVTVTDGNGCQGSDNHAVSVNALPTPTITGLTSVCSGGSVTLDAGSGYASYAWSNGGGSNQTATFSNITNTTTYSVTVTNGNGCQGSDNHAVSVNALPTPSVSGPTSVCSGGSVTLDAGSGYASYAWSNGGGSNQTATFSNITNTTTYSVTVTNANGCAGNASKQVTVSACNNLEFSGRIEWSDDQQTGVNNVTVSLTGAGTGSDVSDPNGDYLISIPTGSGSFVLTPVKSVNKLNGVTAADATAIQQHVAGTTPITNPYRLVAADVNKTNSITTLDATVLNQSLLGNPSALAQFKTSWRFVPQTYTLNNPPWGFPENISMTGVTTNQTGKDFYGIKTGDLVTTYANPANFGAGESLVLQIQDQVLQAGSAVAAEFRAAQLSDLNSFQFALRFDPEQLELLEIEPLNGLPLGMDHFGTYNVAEGEIRVVWSQAEAMALAEAAPLFRLRFKALQSGAQLSAALGLDEEVLPARVYNSAYAESMVQLAFLESTGANPGGDTPALSLDNRPNPFTEATTLRFVLPEAGEVELRVSDATGRLLFLQKKYYAAGRFEEPLRLGNTSGVLFAELITEQGRVVRKMLALR